jgi:hypothetical protein
MAKLDISHRAEAKHTLMSAGLKVSMGAACETL